MTENSFDIKVYYLIGIVVIVILLFTLIKAALFFNDFSHELQYIKIEIRRSSGAERRYWINQKRKLWLSLIPFIKY